MSPTIGIEHVNDQPLTSRQRQALLYIRRRIAEGAPPTIREMVKDLGGSSPSMAQALLMRLEGKGYIERTTSLSRNIRLTEKGAAAE